MASITENLKGIRDYAEKLEIMHDMQKNFFYGGSSSKAISNNITTINSSMNKQGGAVVSVLKGLGKTITSISKSADKLNDTLNKIFDSVKSGIAVNPSSTAEISGVSNLTAPMTTQPIVTERQSAIVENITPLDVGGPEITAALEKNGEIQEETNTLFKDFIKFQKEQVQKETTNRLVNNVKPTFNEPVKEKTKMPARPVFPLSGKEFLGGLGKILKGLLNPVALITAFISKTLPYVILAVAFFKGFWKGLGEELRERLSLWTKRIGLGVAIVFGLFKGIPLLIRTLQLAFYTLKVGYVLAKWAMETALFALKFTHENASFAKDMFLILKKIGHSLIVFAMEIKSIIFGNALKLAAFLFTIGKWVIIIGLIVLLVAGIFLIFSKFGDKILDATKKIIDVFMEVAKMAASIVLLIPNMFIDMIIRLFKGIFGTEKLTPTENKVQTQTSSETAAEEDKRAESFGKEISDAFDNTMKPILEPLQTITAAVRIMALAALNPYSGGMIAPVIRTVASAVVEKISDKVPKTSNADSTDSSIDRNSYVSVNTGKPTEVKLDVLENNLQKIYNILDGWNNDVDRKNWFQPRVR